MTSFLSASAFTSKEISPVQYAQHEVLTLSKQRERPHVIILIVTTEPVFKFGKKTEGRGPSGRSRGAIGAEGVKAKAQVLGIDPLNMRSTCQRRFTIVEVVTDRHWLLL